jgi:6-phosphogluconolactonase
MELQMSKNLLVYIGTYTRSAPGEPHRAEGIYAYRLDSVTGALSFVGAARGLANPAFLALDPQRRFLYSVCEVEKPDSRPIGAVSAFAIDRLSGLLAPLNQQLTHGEGPCYVSVDSTGKWLLAANYRSGNATVFPIQADGSLGAAASVVQHQGSSIHPERQAGPHAHCVIPDPGNRYALVADLGLDRIMLYHFDTTHGMLTPNDPPWAASRPGAGPRHLTFHPNGRFFYSVNELDSTVIAWTYDATRGALQELQTLTTLPSDFAGVSYVAHVQVTPSGRFLYVSNRGHDSLAVFAIDESGALTPVAHAPTLGQWPRHFALDPTGKLLLAANQYSNTVVSFRVDPNTGLLTHTGAVTQVPAPVCVKFVELEG